MAQDIFLQPRSPERPKTIAQGEAAIRELVRDFSNVPRLKQLGMVGALIGTAFVLGRVSDNHTHAVDSEVQHGAVHGAEQTEGQHQVAEIDQQLEAQGISPITLRRGLDRIFGAEVVNQNVQRIAYSPDHIHLPAHYHGRQSFEAGHCTRTPLPHERSTIVLTVDAFQTQSPSPELTIDPDFHTENVPSGDIRDAESISAVILHEMAHSIDFRNAESMPPEIRVRLEGALRDIVMAQGETVYPYVNDYKTEAMALPEQEAAEDELSAEMLSDIIRWPALPQASPLRRMSLKLRVTTQFATRHNITMEQAYAYGEVYQAYADWLGEDFYDRAQLAYEEMRATMDQQIQTVRNKVQRDHVGMILNSIPVPELVPTIRDFALSPERMDPDTALLREESQKIIQAELDQEGEHQARYSYSQPLLSRISRTARSLERRNADYERTFTDPLHHPELTSLFREITYEMTHIRSTMQTVNAIGPSTVITNQALTRSVLLVSRKLQEVQRMQTITDAERQQFFDAIQRWSDGERSGACYRGLREAIPGFSATYGDMMSEEIHQEPYEGNV